MNLSKDQKKSLSEIFGNISVAWFTAAFISPIFFNFKISENTLLSILMSAIMFIVSVWFSLFIVAYKK
jgi:hypothetical protein